MYTYIRSYFVNMNFAITDGQSCVDMVNVQKRGVVQLNANSQVIIPMSNTSCNGRITGFMVSLSKQPKGTNYPRIEVWNPTSSPTEFKMGGMYTLAERDITRMTNYCFANVSFADNETIKFVKGSFIGIYLPPNPLYTVWSINTTGYNYYTKRLNRGMMPRMNLNITRIISVYNLVNDSQPLIQIVFGK